jgi:tight adherence protein B
MSPLTFLFILGALALALLAAGVASLALQRNEAVSTRLSRFINVGSAVAVAPAEKAGREKDRGKLRKTPLADRLNKMLAGRPSSNRIAIALARADLKLTVGEFLALTVISVIAFMALGWLLFNQIALVLLSGVIGYFVPRWYLAIRHRRRLNAFNNQLGDILNLWVNALRSGYSVLQAMEAIARELPPPASVEFNRVVQEHRLGLPLEMALQNLLRRVDSDDLDLVVTAVNVQREVGGNLAEILEVISHTIRERVRIKGEIRVMTAMGRYSGYIITLLPIVLTLLLFVINRPYIMQLFQETCGWIMVGVGLTMMAAGFLAIRKIVDIEV